ncbi:ribosome maturation factor RimP [Kiloniella laminariae]|uniref:Ribosome maturation factor RimP n=1 Tax=Kiloniella laminariae TaxID=454162 RepID=A0ABT4LJQ5_9PROT|nr:ribosome maturation factor RimP [Kiloniella laminariae]MCZ4281312.1 ribosome maturation factor RimP [Kiloniella laminariae]
MPLLAKTSEGKAAQVEQLIAPTLASMGFDIVRVMIMGGEEQKTLQIMAEHSDLKQIMTVENCSDISRAVEAILEVEDPIAGAFRLEISSPGIDRPLTRLSDFERFSGFHAKIEMAVTVDGRKRFTGRLLGVEENAVHLDLEDEEAEVYLSFQDMSRAKLVLTDELIAAAQAGS